MALYLQELALLETTTNTVVKLTNVMEGVEGSGVFNYTVEDVPVRINAGQTLNYKQRHTLDIRVVDDAVPATQAILTQWANAPENYRFKAAGYGGGDFLLWDEPVQLTFPRQRDGVATRRMLMTLDAVPGFAGASGSSKLPVYAGPNLLGIYNVLGGSASYWNGFTNLSGAQTYTQAGGSQTILNVTGTGSATVVPTLPLFFPFNGLILTASTTVSSLSASFSIGGFGTVDNLTNNIPDGATTSASTVSTGRIAATLTIPTSQTVLGLSVFFQMSAVTPGLTATINTPAIRLGYETAWTP